MIKHVIQAREKLLNRMETHSVTVLYSGKAPNKTTDQSYHYTPQRNFFYVTNLSEPHMILMLLKGDSEGKTYLFIEESTDLIIKWEGARMSKEEASAQSGIDLKDIHYVKDFMKFFNLAMNYARSPLGAPPKNLYLDLYHVNPDVKPVALDYAQTIVENYKELTIKNVNEHISYLRMFKSEPEIKQIQKAIDHTKKGLETILENINKRTYEYQLYADFAHAITFDGSEGCAFNTIAASGKNATVLHYEKNNDTLKDGDLILFDLGALHENYASDISRTYPINGKFTERQKVIYDIVLKANKKAIKFVKPGITWKELNDFAKSILIEETKKIGLIKEDEEIANYYYHSIGHFMGLDVHDVGYYHIPLEEGMVLTIEPGLYISEEGIGVRIEDDILVTKNGNINLSESIIKETKDIEKMIK
ncbi:aminopeptidase P family protein [Liberiplasma polymorphum]|uniref:aminopeptidase P family protein n=1 Tax=Liberiplasma polymorphum TaxID=3374570 RepID=UPI0037711550